MQTPARATFNTLLRMSVDCLKNNLNKSSVRDQTSELKSENGNLRYQTRPGLPRVCRRSRSGQRVPWLGCVPAEAAAIIPSSDRQVLHKQSFGLFSELSVMNRG